MDKTERTIKTYDLHAKAYEKKFMDFSSYTQRIKAFCDILAPGASVLDIGCGPGNVAKQLIESNKEFKILGIDLSSEMINCARANVISPQVEFRVSDIRNMGLEGKIFDAVIDVLLFATLNKRRSEKTD